MTIRIPDRRTPDHVDVQLPNAPRWFRDVARNILARLGLTQPTPPPPQIIKQK